MRCRLQPAACLLPPAACRLDLRTLLLIASRLVAAGTALPQYLALWCARYVEQHVLRTAQHVLRTAQQPLNHDLTVAVIAAQAKSSLREGECCRRGGLDLEGLRGRSRQRRRWPATANHPPACTTIFWTRIWPAVEGILAAGSCTFASGNHKGFTNWAAVGAELLRTAVATLAAGGITSLKVKHSWSVIAGLDLPKVAERVKATHKHKKNKGRASGAAAGAAAADSDSDSE